MWYIVGKGVKVQGRPQISTQMPTAQTSTSLFGRSLEKIFFGKAALQIKTSDFRLQHAKHQNFLLIPSELNLKLSAFGKESLKNF